jgi:hypothetical protein
MAEITPQTNRILHHMGRKIGTFGLVNYKRHPEDKNYIVFNFNTIEESDLFESELVKHKIWFEKTTDHISGNGMQQETIYLFAVREGNLDEVTRANAKVHSAFKQPIFQNKLLRYALLIFFGGLIAVAIVGYVKNPPKTQPGTIETNRDSL